MPTFRENRAWRWFVAALLVPLLVIGGPGSPVAIALAAHDGTKAHPPVGHQQPISTDAFSPAPVVQPNVAPARRPDPDGIALATRPARVLVLEKDAPIDGTLLFDGNAKTTFRPESGQTVRLVVEFSKPLWLDGLSLFGDAPGELGLASNEGTKAIELSEVSSSGWRSYRFEHALWGQTFHFDWTPGALELPGEWAFWQRGSERDLGLGATPENLLPLGSFPGGAEHAAWPQAATVSHGVLGQQSSATFKVALPNPASASRAYLVYELEGAPHFTHVKRAFNGQAALGGTGTAANGGAGLQVEEIPVAGLRAGENRIDFYPASALVTPEYQVKNLRIVTLAAGSVLESLTFALEERGFSRKAEREFAAVTAPEEISFLLKQPTQGKISLRGGPKDVYTIDLSALKPGWHTLPVRSKLRPAAKLQAVLDPKVTPGSITEVIVSGLSLPREISGEIVLSYPLQGECFDGEAVVRGFVQGVQRPRLLAQGKPVDVLRDGSFQLTTVGTAESDWMLTLEAEGAGQRTVLERSMQPCLSSVSESITAEQLIEDDGAPFAQVVTSAGATLSFAGARLDIPAGALTEPTRITIRPLPRSAVPQMNPGMTNVTPLGQAYRFGPHGLNFEGPVTLSLPYEEESIPPAAGEGHVAGYFYDDVQARWVQVGRAGQADAGRHDSFTHHFTDFVNATIATPDAPGAAAFAQTGMSGIGVGDPLAGVTSMAPPAANPFGNAVTSLPIELPPGRNGMTPSLALTYDSNQGSSWVGYGWRLAGLSKIELDTRFGVPDYESQYNQLIGKLKYSLDGEQLTEVGTVSGAKQFRRRVEGSFQHIVQLTAPDGTGAKYFEVTAQDGTKYTYGKTSAAREYDPAAPSHVAAWHLESVVDVYGNAIMYTYWRIEKSLNGTSCTMSEAICAYGLLPLMIEYTKHTSAAHFHYYRVRFPIQEGHFGDERVSGRAGFLTFEGELLSQVQVELVTPQGNQLIRTYFLNTDNGVFSKRLLNGVTQVGPSGEVLAEHKFTYSKIDEFPSGDGEGALHTWIDAYEPEQVLASAQEQANYSLGQRNGWNFALSTGVSLFLFSSDLLSVGVSVNANVGSTWGSHSFFDVSGDGLPDYLDAYGDAQLGQYRHGNWGLDLRGTPLPYEWVDYNAGDPIDSMLPLTVNAGTGVEAGTTLGGLEVAGQLGISTAMDFRTFADMDGDGFPDRVEVYNGEVRVYRNQGSGPDPQTFGDGSYEIWGNVDPLDFVNSDGRLGEVENRTSQTDPLVRWVAPRDGTVRVAGSLERVEGGPFGAQATIYRESEVMWTRPIAETDASPCVPGLVNCGGAPLEIPISGGQSLYFRVHARTGYERSDPVQWQPTLQYTDAGPTELAQLEPYGRPVDRFSLVDDFRIASGVSMPFTTALTGVAELGGVLRKQQTPDNLRATIYKVVIQNGVPQRTVLWEQFVPAPANTMGQDLTVSTANLPALPAGQLEAGTLLEFALSSDAPIDPKQVTWEPHVRYLDATVPDPFPGRSDVTGPVACSMNPQTGQPDCFVQNGVNSVKLPPSTASKRAPVSFLQPFSAPTVRTQQFHATATEMQLTGDLSVTGPFGYGRTVGMCQGTNRILLTVALDGPGHESIAFLARDLTPGDLITCSLRAEGNPAAVFFALNAVGADVTSVPINRRSELAPGPSAHQYDHLRVLSGQFHGWSFGDWDSAAAFNADLIQEDQLAQERPAFFPATPGKQGDQTTPDAWRGRGGAFIAANGLLNPGVVSTSEALDGGEHGDGSMAVRISHAFTYGASISTPINTIGFAESQYVQDRELLDMNGDRMADSVTAFGVSYSTGCIERDGDGECDGGFTGNNEAMRTIAAETLTKITKARVGLDVVANGGKVTLVRASRDGVPQAVSNLGIGLGTDHASTVTKQELLDINGDGLPDHVKWDEASGRLLVHLNLGYTFKPELEEPPIEWAEHAVPHPWQKGIYPQPLVQEAEGFEGVRDKIDQFMGAGEPGPGEPEPGEPELGGRVQTALAYSEVTTLTPSVGGGVVFDGGAVALAVSGGAAYQHSIRRDLGRFVDVTGDGLLDYVVARGTIGVSRVDPDTGASLGISDTWLHVFPNLGTTFGHRQMWNVPNWNTAPTSEVGKYLNALNFVPDDDRSQEPLSALSVSRSSDWTIFESVQICFLIACVSLASSQAIIEEKSLVELQDVNGDGLPDFVMKEPGANATRAKLNKLAGINLLTGIEGPAGRKLTLHYGSEGATHEQPGVSYVLKQVDVEDGQGNTYTSEYEYLASGNTSRSEREFLGYQTVNEYRPNDSCVQTTYENDDFYRKGLPSQRTVNMSCPSEEVVGTLLKETFDYEPPTNVPVGGSHHPYEKVRTRSLLEGQATGPTTTETRTWDPNHGNLASLVITGDEANKDVTYTIDYVSPGPHIIKPSRVRAVGAGITWRDRRATYGSRGDLLTASNYNTTGATLLSQTAVTSRDVYGNPRTIVDPTGGATTYEYDNILNTYVGKVTDPHGLTSTAVYNSRLGVPTTITDANGGIRTYGYDEFGRVTSFTGPLDQGSGVPTVLYEYSPIRLVGTNFEDDPVWIKVRHKDVSRNLAMTPLATHDFIEVVSFADGLGRIIQTKKDMARDHDGKPEAGMSVSGKILFDDQGRPIEIGQPTFSTRSATTFVVHGAPVNPSEIDYDNLDRVVRTSTPIDDHSTAFVSTTTSFEHQMPAGGGLLKHATLIYTSDHTGLLKMPRRILRDADGQIAEIQEYNRLGSSSAATLLVTRYETNPMNELQVVTDPAGNQTTTLYNALGLVREMRSPDMGRVVWTYRPDGNVATKETAQLRDKGEITTYLYDLDRLIGVDFENPNSTDISIEYGTAAEAGGANGNLAGRIKSQTSEAGRKSFKYDALGQVVEESTTFDRKGVQNGADYTITMQYEHDPFGRLLETRFTGPDRELVSYVYDEGGNLQSVFGQRLGFNPDALGHPHHTTYLAHRGYDEFGQKVTEVAGNLIPTAYTYGGRSRRLIHLERDLGTPVNSISYEYDSVGNIVSILNEATAYEEASGVQVPATNAVFTYDNLDQLRTATATGSVQLDDFRYAFEQQYDNLGNIIAKEQASFIDNGASGPVDIPVAGQTYDNDYTYTGSVKHAPSRVVGNGVTTDYQYDPSGNRILSTNLTETKQFTWTEDDLLRSVKRSSDSYDLVRNYYDATGQKAISLHPGTTATEEIAYAGNMTLRSEGNARYVTKHIYAGAERLASKMDARWFAEDNVQYYATDHLGSTNFTFDSEQNLISHTEYFPSGEVWRSETSSAYAGLNPYSFTGKEWDAVTGLYDFGARQYDPRLGQWLSPDPILASYMRGAPNGGVYWPANLNGYSYVANNSLKYVDRYGEFPLVAAAIIGGSALFSAGLDAGIQYLEARSKHEAFEYDYWRGAIALGFGGLAGAGGVAANAIAQTTGGALGLGAVFSAGAAMGHTGAMQLHQETGYDPKEIATSGLYGLAGGAAGAAAMIATRAAVRAATIGAASKEALILVDYLRRVNTGSLGGTLSKAGDRAREAARAARAAGTTAGESAASAAYEAASRSLGDGAGTGGNAPPAAGRPGGEGEQGRPHSPGSGGRYNPAFNPYLRDQHGGH